MIVRPPRHPALQGVVQLVWAAESTAPRAPALEQMLPNGAVHVVLRFDDPVTIFDGPDDAAGRVFHALVGGLRDRFWQKEASDGGASVGALVEPGHGSILGLPPGELSGRHVDLADVWGADAGRTRDRLSDGDAAARLDRFEALLAARVAPLPHPIVRHALARFRASSASPTVSEVQRESGYSHRYFTTLFHREVGLTPKVYCRIRRTCEALALLRDPRLPLADVATKAGFFDQAHMNRDFRAITGLSPGAYRAIDPVDAHHVPVAR
jgi:AraC-like DNA-binding protein